MTPWDEDTEGKLIDFAKPTVVYLPVSHLDTQWRWTVRDTIRSFLPKTLADHRDRFARFPNYCVNFDGAFRYALIEEYDPDGFEELTRWIAEGRWKVSGAFWDAADVNVPSPESLVRQCLYGKQYFQQKFDQDPADIFLPDCFGFGAQLPIIARHCGLVGFTSSKLRRDDWMRSSVGIPFPIGVWEGPDGSEIVCALDPGGYGEPLTKIPTEEPKILEQIEHQRQLSGQPLSVRYFGIGDKGGAPAAESLETLERAVAEDSVVTTRPAGSDELFRELHKNRETLPRHHGDILLSTHGTGCYTAHAAMKRCNQDNEFLGEAAEKAASAANWLGGLPYPDDVLRSAWQRLLWHQFHDDLTGTSIPAAYDISWNDQGIVANQFSEVLRQAVGSVARSLDTRSEGTAVVVFNPISQPRTDVVEAWIDLPTGSRTVHVTGPDGRSCPAQVESDASGRQRVVFVADLPSLGFAVFDVVGKRDAYDRPSDGLGLREQDNGTYRMRIDDRGDLAELFDHRLGRDLLSGPTRLQLLPNRSVRFPAWEIQYEDVVSPPLAQVRGPSNTRLLAQGPARVVIETRRQAKGSTFIQRFRLAKGEAGDRLEVQTFVDWKTRGSLLQAAFPLAASSPTALFDRGVTAVEHGIVNEKIYEVPAQQWALQRAEDGTWGTAILARAKYGWNKPDAETLRLTLLHTPRVGRRFRHQGILDIGRHDMSWALFGFSQEQPTKSPGGPDPALPATPWAASRFNQPPMPFIVDSSAGPLGRSWSFIKTQGGPALVRAVKKAEQREELIVRLQELTGCPGRTSLQIGAEVGTAKNLDGIERPVEGPAPQLRPSPTGSGESEVAIELSPWTPQTIGLELIARSEPLTGPQSRPLSLKLNWTLVSKQGEQCQEGLLGRQRGFTFPGELWPQQLTVHGIPFDLATAGVHHSQVLRCRGQQLAIPAGEGAPETDRVYLLACSLSKRRTALFQSSEGSTEVVVPSATETIYAWDRTSPTRARWLRQLKTERGHLYREPIAWVATHTHDRRGRDLPYRLGYLFLIELPWQGGSIVLPEDEEVAIAAATLAKDPNRQALPASSPFNGNTWPEVSPKILR